MNAAFERISIIGLGLIGSSIARAAREHKLAKTIIAFDSNPLALTYARTHGFIDEAAKDVASVAKDCDLVILATPPSGFAEIARQIAPHLANGAIIMDAASIKRMPIQSISQHLPAHVHFIPAHPIAGSEQSGVNAGRADLFTKRHVILTPENAEMTDALSKSVHFWQAMGARVEAMPAELHDMIYAYVSHLPHLLAFAAAHTLGCNNAEKLRSFLRLSNSNPDLWSELFTLNQDNILAALTRYMDATNHVLQELSQAPDDAVEGTDKRIAREVLFPRIAASCLITTVMEAERKAGVPFARYAGQGFADFASPASAPPDDDLEGISAHFKQVAALLKQYNHWLMQVHDLLARNQYQELARTLSGE